MRKKLSERWVLVLQGLPESGMGYQRVDVTFSDGSQLENVLAFNCEEIELPDAFLRRAVESIQPSRRRRNS